MNIFEIGPLQLEKILIANGITLIAVVVLGRGVHILQRRWHLSNLQSMSMHLASLAAVIALSVYFLFAERFASYVTPLLNVIGFIEMLALAALVTVGLYVWLGGKLPRNRS
ncbi:hypothetical protein [Pseudomonas baetica]|uniref:hypothetical protein n=1 Tax=Pseudomonas baetica TaxID=674054 RepID=UPI00240571C0|nr:hypothetical protein [Pseudomonas baetica]MDF9779256.1 hypothetical protein [Pseudomonas baetica]